MTTKPKKVEDILPQVPEQQAPPKTLMEAYFRFQQEVGHATFDSQNPHFKSDFASLKQVIDTVRPVLNRHGITFIQRSVPCDGGVSVETTFHGYDGTISTGAVFMPVDRANAHATMGAYTYAKRCSLVLATGIGVDKDDDGNAATANAPRPTSVTQTVIEEESLAMDEEKKEDYLYRIEDAFKLDDKNGCIELIQELTEDEKLIVWNSLPSKARTQIRKWGNEDKQGNK